MKNAFLILFLSLLLIPTLVKAQNPDVVLEGEEACMLYDAMALEPVAIVGTPQIREHVKTLLGLSCTFWDTYMNGHKQGCSCEFKKNLNRFQREQIYDSVDVEEGYALDFDIEIFTKAVGSLVFEKATYIKYDREQKDYYFSIFGEKYQYQYK